MSIEERVALVGLLAAAVMVTACGDGANASDEATSVARTDQCPRAANCESDAGISDGGAQDTPPASGCASCVAEEPIPGEDVPDAGGSPGPTMLTSGLHLYDACGERVVLLGVNHPTLYVDRAGAAMSEIARTGANAVRIFWFATNGVAIT